MQYLHRETVRRMLDRAGFDPDHVIREDYSPYPGSTGRLALRVNRDAMDRVAREAEISGLPVTELRRAMAVDQTPDEYDLVHFEGFALSPADEGVESTKGAGDPLGRWIEDNVSSEYREIANQIPRGLNADEVRAWLRDNGWDSPLALDLVDRAERDGVLGKADAATGTSGGDEGAAEPAPEPEGDRGEGDTEEATDTEGADPLAGMPPFLRDLLRGVDNDKVKVSVGSASGVIDDLFKSMAEAGSGPHGSGCDCLTAREERVVDLVSKYREMADARDDLKSVAMMDAILAELR